MFCVQPADDDDEEDDWPENEIKGAHLFSITVEKSRSDEKKMSASDKSSLANAMAWFKKHKNLTDFRAILQETGGPSNYGLIAAERTMRVLKEIHTMLKY